jgi:four helix bundle protein
MPTTLPEGERFGFVLELQRAAVSVPANIAEGYGRQATGEDRHHLAIALGSLLKLETLLLLREDLAVLERSALSGELEEIAHLNRMLTALLAKLR